MTFKICRVLCPRTEKTLLLRKAKEVQVTVSKEKGTERDNNILFNNLEVFDVFGLFPAIIMQYLYDSVWVSLKRYSNWLVQRESHEAV